MRRDAEKLVGECETWRGAVFLTFPQPPCGALQGKELRERGAVGVAEYGNRMVGEGMRLPRRLWVTPASDEPVACQ